MKVLIIGDYPGFFGGVTNYTRPLAEELSRHVEVCYLYNCTRTGNYDFSGMRIVERDDNPKFKSYELLNGKAQYTNYKELELDHNNWFDEQFDRFLEREKPDCAHINEIFGFSSNIINICKARGIKTIVTVHEYWWLCPHRVMVDYNRKICDGPSDISKCGHCISERIKSDKYSTSKLRQKLRHVFPGAVEQYRLMKKRLLKESFGLSKVSLDFSEETYSEMQDERKKSSITNRLTKNIENLNKADKIIGVSQDVKNILKSFGVSEKKIMVQHIGSTIAAKKIVHLKKVDSNKIVFGFIGGVGYYKGVHQLIEAFLMLPDEIKNRAKLEIWGNGDKNYVYSLNKTFLENSPYSENIELKGGFTPADLTNITNRIDISVLPSLCADTAPQTIFESFSAGLPIIAPNIGGFPDFVIDRKNGLLYDKADVKSLSQRLQEVVENPEIIRSFQQNIPSLKSIQENTSELLELYRSLTTAARPVAQVC